MPTIIHRENSTTSAAAPRRYPPKHDLPDAKLGMPRQTLESKINTLPIDRHVFRERWPFGICRFVGVLAQTNYLSCKQLAVARCLPS